MDIGLSGGAVAKLCADHISSGIARAEAIRRDRATAKRAIGFDMIYLPLV
jgi:hypothetical protein